MKQEQVTPVAEPVGVPSTQIGKYPGSIEFTLPDSGQKVLMRKPMLQDMFAATADKTIDFTIVTASTASLMAQICLFDGKPMNFHDWGKSLSLVDYNFIVDKYNNEITEPGK